MKRIELVEAVADTDALSFMFNRDPVRSPRYVELLRGTTVFVSFATVAEMRFGALLRNWGVARLRALDDYLSQYEIVESSRPITNAWATLRVESQRMGRTIERQDAWIAATAIHLGLPLVTHNAAHFNHLSGLRVLTEADR
jgi:tRNA(fMet)-specific endonuclease VapC